MEFTLIGYDLSDDPSNLVVRCEECARLHPPPSWATRLYAGDEWGGAAPECDCCSGVIDGLALEDSE